MSAHASVVFSYETHNKLCGQTARF